MIYFRPQAETRESVALWRRLVQGGLEVHEVPGDHLSMLLEPHVQDLAEKLALCLSKAQDVLTKHEDKAAATTLTDTSSQSNTPD